MILKITFSFCIKQLYKKHKKHLTKDKIIARLDSVITCVSFFLLLELNIPDTSYNFTTHTDMHFLSFFLGNRFLSS